MVNSKARRLIADWKASGKRFCLTTTAIHDGKKAPYFSNQPAFLLATTTNTTLQQIYELHVLKFNFTLAMNILIAVDFKE